MNEDDGDARLLNRWRSGDARAGADLIHAHFRVVRGMFRRIPSEDAEDLAQQTFLACLVSGSRLRDAAKARSFLAAVARHHLYKYRRSVQRADRRALLVANYLAAIKTEPGDIRDDGLLEKELMNALQQLPRDLRVVVELSYWRELANHELAKCLGLPSGTIASRLRRAKERLRKLIEHRYEEAQTA